MQPRLDEVQHTINILQREAIKLKAINAVHVQSNLVSNIQHIQREDARTRADKAVDIKAKVRDAKQFLKK